MGKNDGIYILIAVILLVGAGIYLQKNYNLFGIFGTGTDILPNSSCYGTFPFISYSQQYDPASFPQVHQNNSFAIIFRTTDRTGGCYPIPNLNQMYYGNWGGTLYDTNQNCLAPDIGNAQGNVVVGSKWNRIPIAESYAAITGTSIGVSRAWCQKYGQVITVQADATRTLEVCSFTTLSTQLTNYRYAVNYYGTGSLKVNSMSIQGDSFCINYDTPSDFINDTGGHGGVIAAIIFDLDNLKSTVVGDTNGDGKVDRTELGVVITSWQSGSVSRADLGAAITSWVG